MNKLSSSPQTSNTMPSTTTVLNGRIITISTDSSQEALDRIIESVAEPRPAMPSFTCRLNQRSDALYACTTFLVRLLGVIWMGLFVLVSVALVVCLLLAATVKLLEFTGLETEMMRKIKKGHGKNLG